MWAIFKKSFRDKLTSGLIYTGVGLFMLIIYLFMQPNLSQNMQVYSDLIKILPSNLLKAFNADISAITSLEATLSSKQYGMLWPFITIIFSTTIASASFAGEIDRKTISILLAQPISRAKIFWAKYLAGLTLLILYVLIVVPTTIFLAPIFNIEINELNFLKFTIEAIFFVIAFYSLSTAISVFASETGIIYFITIGLCIGMYFVKVISLILEQLDGLKYFSVFYYYDPIRSLVNGELMPIGLLLFAIVSGISVIMAYFRFIKRDITV
mgnify:CR=1 FL=1